VENSASSKITKKRKAEDEINDVGREVPKTVSVPNLWMRGVLEGLVYGKGFTPLKPENKGSNPVGSHMFRSFAICKTSIKMGLTLVFEDSLTRKRTTSSSFESSTCGKFVFAKV